MASRMDTPPEVAIVLAGGFGTRLRSVYPDLPKPFVPVAGKPFIEWIIRYWSRHGIHKFVISLGHLADVGESYFRGRPDDGLEIRTICEQAPLGTAGAVLHACREVPEADPVLVANGDSIFLADLAPVWTHLTSHYFDCAILSVIVSDAGRYGSLRVSEDGTVLGFYEKRPGQGTINAGVYVFPRRTLERFPPKLPLSMETDVFPHLIGSGARILACAASAAFIDIGTVPDLERATAFIQTEFPDQ
jgi:D-glycero-alpha-D-manno-heptose 1-phosphate guanylyltransferase